MARAFPVRTAALGAVVFFVSSFSMAQSQFEHFITARGDRLMDGDRELRFVSYDIPNLHYIEDDFRFEEPNPWRIADAFEIRDALMAIKQSGGAVTRMYVPSVRKAIDDSSIVRHVLGPGQFNEEAFKAYDRVLQAANEIGVRVIIPLVDNWWWWGGPKEYAAFRGKAKEEFWTDSVLIADFEKTVAAFVNRVNSITGVPYSQDKAILAWETGNELQCPYAWTHRIAAYIKSLDRNHLVMEGTSAQAISEEALADSAIDVLSTHHYLPAREATARIAAARAVARGKKPYLVGEFGFIPTAEMRAVIDTVIAEGVSGIMVWSMRVHNRDGGFYYHTNDYRWPGFPSGKDWDEPAVVRLFREKAAEINNRPVDSLPTPETPRLLPIETPYKISWQGSAGAESYLLERKGEDEMFWQVIAPKASDALARYRPLFSDTTAEPGKRYWYRIRARNVSGISEPSEPVGPVVVRNRMLIDELDDSSKIAGRSGRLEFVSPKDIARAKQDPGRLAGGSGAFIEYRVPAGIVSARADLFVTQDSGETVIQLLAADSTGVFSRLTPEVRRFAPLKNEYGMYPAVSYQVDRIPGECRVIRIVLARDVQLSRVEIEYGAGPKEDSTAAR